MVWTAPNKLGWTLFLVLAAMSVSGFGSCMILVGPSWWIRLFGLVCLFASGYIASSAKSLVMRKVEFDFAADGTSPRVRMWMGRRLVWGRVFHEGDKLAIRVRSDGVGGSVFLCFSGESVIVDTQVRSGFVRERARALADFFAVPLTIDETESTG